MTLAGFRATSGQAGPPALDRHNGDLRELGWPDALCGASGWWWAVVQGEAVIAAGWTSGGHRDRDAELARAACSVAPLIAARRAG